MGEAREVRDGPAGSLMVGERPGRLVWLWRGAMVRVVELHAALGRGVTREPVDLGAVAPRVDRAALDGLAESVGADAIGESGLLAVAMTSKVGTPYQTARARRSPALTLGRDEVRRCGGGEGVVEVADVAGAGGSAHSPFGAWSGVRLGRENNF